MLFFQIKEDRNVHIQFDILFKMTAGLVNFIQTWKKEFTKLHSQVSNDTQFRFEKKTKTTYASKENESFR